MLISLLSDCRSMDHLQDVDDGKWNTHKVYKILIETIKKIVCC